MRDALHALGALVVPLGWLLAAAGSCWADSIHLNAEGIRNLDELRSRIAPATIFTDSRPMARPYIRCVIVDERPARDRTARHDSIEGSPEYDVIAFDATGEQRSGVRTISRAWVHHVDQDYDSELDVRGLFSDRDRRAGVALGSRTYFAMAKRAGDPEGRLGLWRHDEELPPEPQGVVEGDLIRFLRDPPVFVGGDAGEAWRRRRTAEDLEITKAILAGRLPASHRQPDARPSLLVPKLVDAMARERAYRLSRTGYDRTALSMLVFVLDLAAVKHREVPAGDDAADMVYFEGVRAVAECFEVFAAASAWAQEHADPPELPSLYHAYQAATDPAERRRILAEYERLQDRLASGDRSACPVHRQFCVDSSQRAAAAIDALLASEGMFFVPERWRPLVDAVLLALAPREGPNPHKYARIDLREPVMRLIVRGMNPPRAVDAAGQRAREETAARIRGHLLGLLREAPAWPGQHDAARAVLTVGGWGPAAPLRAHAEALLDLARDRAGRALRSGEDPAEAEYRRWCRDACATSLEQLHAVAELAASPIEAERQAAEHVLSRIEEMRKRAKDRQGDHPAYRYILALWDEPARPAR